MSQLPKSADAALPARAAGPAETAHSGIREVVDVAISTPGCLRLEVGEPDFPTPTHIVEAAVEFLRSGHVRYTATPGLLSLRERISAMLARDRGLAAAPDQICCATGAVGAIAAALASVVEHREEVLVPDPGWPNYRLMLSWIGAGLVAYPCRPENGYVPDPEEVERLITPRTKVLIVNSPSNPTGALLPRSVLAQLVAVAQRRNLYLLSDECYDRIVFDGEHVSPASLCDDGRVISAFSFSKTYAMTGWRVGYVVAEPGVADSIVKVLESNSSCVAEVSQRAAEAALDGPQEPVLAMVNAYRRRRDLCVEQLEAADLPAVRPGGAFYIMADVRQAGAGSRELALRLVREAGVAVAPGAAFGRVAEGQVRISLASSEDDLREGIARIAAYVHESAGHR